MDMPCHESSRFAAPVIASSCPCDRVELPLKVVAQSDKAIGSCCHTMVAVPQHLNTVNHTHPVGPTARSSSSSVRRPACQTKHGIADEGVWVVALAICKGKPTHMRVSAGLCSNARMFTSACVLACAPMHMYSPVRGCWLVPLCAGQNHTSIIRFTKNRIEGLLCNKECLDALRQEQGGLSSCLDRSVHQNNGNQEVDRLMAVLCMHMHTVKESVMLHLSKGHTGLAKWAAGVCTQPPRPIDSNLADRWAFQLKALCFCTLACRSPNSEEQRRRHPRVSHTITCIYHMLTSPRILITPTHPTV
eukprot:1159003-Pelagomonas_calceolata.AAC.1